MDALTVTMLAIPTLVVLALVPVIARVAWRWAGRGQRIPPLLAAVGAVALYAPAGLYLWHGIFALEFIALCVRTGGAGC